MRKTINAVGYYSDGQDGGGSIYIHNNLEELKAYHFSDDEERYESALNGDNPYEDGEIDTDVSINIEIDEQGNARLTDHIWFHYGQ
jgi:hypothetical protein